MAYKFHHTKLHFSHTGKGRGYDLIRKKKTEIRDKSSLRILELDFILLNRFFILLQSTQPVGEEGSNQIVCKIPLSVITSVSGP